MSDIQITNGSSLVEDITAVYSEIKIFGLTDDKKLLLVEGKDDIELIRNYYHMKNKDQPFRPVLSDYVENNKAGKKHAIESFNYYRNHFQKLLCLLDRDYDFILKIEEQEPNILYYDYYELENHLFDPPVLRLIFLHYFKCNTTDHYNRLHENLSVIKDTLIIIAHLKIFRELHYHGKIQMELDDMQLNKLVTLCKPNYESIFKHREYGEMNYKDRLEEYISSELEEVEIDLQTILNETDVYFQNIDYNDFLERYFSGKEISKLLIHFFQDEFSENPTSNARSISEYLKIWIPNSSTKFEQQMELIESK